MHQKMYVINNPKNVCIHEMKKKNRERRGKNTHSIRSAER